MPTILDAMRAVALALGVALLTVPHAAAVCVSVGGAFDLVSGVKRYAPAWMQRAGLTWLHRMSQEPRRLGSRYVKYNSTFLWLLIRHELLRRGLPMRNS